MKTSGMGVPETVKADVAYFRVAEVQIAQHGFGRRAPGRSLRIRE